MSGGSGSRQSSDRQADTRANYSGADRTKKGKSSTYNAVRRALLPFCSEQPPVLAAWCAVLRDDIQPRLRTVHERQARRAEKGRPVARAQRGVPKGVRRLEGETRILAQTLFVGRKWRGLLLTLDTLHNASLSYPRRPNRRLRPSERSHPTLPASFSLSARPLLYPPSSCVSLSLLIEIASSPLLSVIITSLFSLNSSERAPPQRSGVVVPGCRDSRFAFRVTDTAR